MASSAAILNDLYAVMTSLRSLPPVLTAIWFVDRPRDYYASRARYGYPEQYDPFALPVYEWQSQAATEEEWQRAPALCGIPDIHLHMSDGTARLLAPDAIAALLDGSLNPHKYTSAAPIARK